MVRLSFFWKSRKWLTLDDTYWWNGQNDLLRACKLGIICPSAIDTSGDKDNLSDDINYLYNFLFTFHSSPKWLKTLETRTNAYLSIFSFFCTYKKHCMYPSNQTVFCLKVIKGETLIKCNKRRGPNKSGESGFFPKLNKLASLFIRHLRVGSSWSKMSMDHEETCNICFCCPLLQFLCKSLTQITHLWSQIKILVFISL